MAHPNIHFSTCAHRRGREKGALTPIRRPRTPQTLPHMLPSGTEFGAGHAVRMPPRTSAAAAVGRQRGPPRIGSENSPRGRRWQSPELRSAVAAYNAAGDRARLPGVRQRTGAEAPAAGCSSGGHRSSARGGTWRASRGSREVSGEQRGRQRCRCNRWAVRVALTCQCTSSTSSKRMLLGRPVRVKGAGYNRAAHN